jgi:hypothetical protein
VGGSWRAKSSPKEVVVVCVSAMAYEGEGCVY